MARFIIEIDDAFIRERGDIEHLKKKGAAGNVLKEVYDRIAFGMISRQLDKGITEFHVNREMMDGVCREFYDNNASDVCMLAYMAMKEEDIKK
jgi:hypothetical protein